MIKENLNIGDKIYYNIEGIYPYSKECYLTEINESSLEGIIDGTKIHIDITNEYEYSKEPKYEVVPCTIKYYKKEYDIDGTSDELFIQVRNNYIDDKDTLKYIEDILKNEGKINQAKLVSYKRDSLEAGLMGKLGQIKYDIVSESKTETFIEEDMEYRLEIDVIKEDDNILMDISTYHSDGSNGKATSLCSLNDFLNFSEKDFDNFIMETLFYNEEIEDEELEIDG